MHTSGLKDVATHTEQAYLLQRKKLELRWMENLSVQHSRPEAQPGLNPKFPTLNSPLWRLPQSLLGTGASVCPKGLGFL